MAQKNMSAIFMYIDQNILSLCTKGMSLDVIPNVLYVYSQEHLKEISRSDSPDKYLDGLQNINAVYLNVFDILSSRLEYRYETNLSPHARYESYINAINTSFYQNLFDPLLAFLNGGDCYEEVQKIPDVLQCELNKLKNNMLGLLSEETMGESKIFKEDIDKQINNVADVLRMTLQEKLPSKVNKEDIRNALGFKKGELGTRQDANKIEIVSEKLKSFLPNEVDSPFEYILSTYTQQFQGNIFSRVICACTQFDLFGFKAEGKCKETKKIQNILSDMMHIAYATFCYGLISTDKRLCLRAREVYNYEKLHTKILWATNGRYEEI